jgi:hypothetical protein
MDESYDDVDGDIIDCPNCEKKLLVDRVHEVYYIKYEEEDADG